MKYLFTELNVIYLIYIDLILYFFETLIINLESGAIMIDPAKRAKLIKDMENDKELENSVKNLSKSLNPFIELNNNARLLADNNIIVPYQYEHGLKDVSLNSNVNYFSYTAIEKFIDNNFLLLSKELEMNILQITSHLGDNLKSAQSNMIDGNYTSSLLIWFSILDGVVYSLYDDTYKQSVKQISSSLINESTYNPNFLRSVLTTDKMISNIYAFGISKDIVESDEYPRRNKFMHGMNQRPATKRDCYIVFTTILNITTIHAIENIISQNGESIIELF